MKIPYLVPALLAPALFAQTYIETPPEEPSLPGNVSTMTLGLTVTETTGGYLIKDGKTEDPARRIKYKENITYDEFFQLNPVGSNVRNPLIWDLSRGNNYVERETASGPAGQENFTLDGVTKLSKTRYSTAQLLADLAEAEIIPSANGYRIVAVRFETTVPEMVYRNVDATPTYDTVVRRGLYFFAERAPQRGVPDANPIFLGAEDDGVYAVNQIIDFASYETAEAGKYTDLFTRDQNGNLQYTLKSDSFSGVALGEFSIYRRPSATEYYEMRVGGPFNWKETYNTRTLSYDRGAISSKTLSGPGTLYVQGSGSTTFVPSAEHEGVVTGSISLPAAKYETSLVRYLRAIPPIR